MTFTELNTELNTINFRYDVRPPEKDIDFWT